MFLSKLKHIILPVLFFFVTYVLCLGQLTYYSDYHFRYLTMDDGLSNYRVNSICKDKNGFMWFGTNEGLNRFDGYNFKIFKNEQNDPNSINNNIIRQIINLKDGRLCIATDGGIDFYDDDIECFTHLECFDKNKCMSTTWSVNQGKDGTLWIGCLNGLFYKKKDEPKARNFTTENSWFNNYEVTEVYEDKSQNLWIGTKEQGIFVYHTKIKKYSHFLADPNNPKAINQNWIEAIYQDKEGNIWIGTNESGINLFNPKDSTFSSVPISGVENSKIRVRDFAQDKFGRLWVGTFIGLYMKVPGKNEIYEYAVSSNPYSKLLNNSIYDILIDDNDLLWVGTYAGGVNYCDFNQKKFRHFEASSNDNRYLNDRIIYSVIQDKDSNIWVATERGGVNFYNRKTFLFTYYNMDNTILQSNNIKALVCDLKNNLWIGTYKGLYYFNTKTKKIITYLNDPKNPASLSHDIIYNLASDDDDNLWIGTRNGVDLLPLNGKKFIHYPSHFNLQNGLKKDAINCILIDSKKNVWVGSALYGLFKYNKNENDFIQYSDKIVSQAIYTLCEDTRGQIWAGGIHGFFCINPQNKNIIHYTENDGLPTNTVYRIIDDKDKNLWISTTTGITKFINGVNTPNIPKFQTYNSRDGIFIKQFTNNSYFKSASGELFFAGVDGFVSFFPDQIKENPFLPAVQITQLKIFNKDVQVGQKIENIVVLTQAINKSKEINLSFKHNVFSLEFAGLHYSIPENIKYAYILEGFDKDWTYTSADKRMATYTNLHGGKYIFKVRASNSDGKWNDSMAILVINIRPPFWRTPLFYVFLFIFLILLIAFIIRFRTKSLEVQKQMLEKRVKERTMDVSEANVMLEERQEEIVMQNEELAMHRNNLERLVLERTSELEKAKSKAEESDHLKLAFLANMSHEIRTPMNAIVGFSSLMIDEADVEERKKYLEIINNNSNSLLVLINDILDISMIESNQLKFMISTFDPLPIFREFEKTALLKDTKKLDIQLKNTGSESSVTIKADIIRFRQIVGNLIDNALKYTDEGHIYFGFEVQGDKVVFYFEDTGIGINQSNFDKIFNYFEKIESTKIKLYRGTGIGLSICKKLVEIMGGSIWLQSGENKGSTFYFSLPCENVSSSTQIANKQEDKIEIADAINIIIAEDEVANTFLLEKILNKRNLPVLFKAINGREVVHYLKQHNDLKNTVVLMDIKMPELNGIEALEEIRKFNKTIPIIAVTAYATEIEKREILQHSFAGYVSKPINREELYRVIMDVAKKNT
jgi:ligand-binding sensor domain-containing protein/signal transduction histidine kinase/CheY-like chemotaxis protein